jgi:hypothetical protein
MEQLIGFLATYRFSEQAPPPHAEFREEVFACCLQSSSGVVPPPAANVALPGRVVALMSEALPVTPGAAQRIGALRDAFPVLKLLIGDKMFKNELRAYAAAAGIPDAAQRLISVAAGLSEVARQPIVKVDRPRFGSAATAVAAVAAPAAAAPPRVVPFRPQPVTRPQVPALPIEALLEQLASETADINVLVASLRAAAASEQRIRLLLHHRAWLRGTVHVAEAVRPYFLAEVVRVYTAFNANESAHRASSRLAAEYCAMGGPADSLPQREVMRFLGLHARACLRSGRTTEAKRIYRNIFFQNLTNAGALIEYFNAIFATDERDAEAAARAALINNVEVDYFGCLALAEFFLQRNSLAEALSFVQRAEKKAADRREHVLTLANIALAQDDHQLWYDCIRRFGETGGMPVVAFDTDEAMRTFALSGNTAVAEPREELVSIVMTSFNSSATIERAVRSVLAQVGANIELVIVDDVSTDNSREVISALAAADPRITPIFNSSNMGTYASKNYGMTVAKGSILGFHDSDDWMHPLKVNRQLNELMKGFVCTTSQWLRMRDDGRVVQRRGGGYTHLNPASTLFRRELVDEIGPFDYVRTGADAEYLTRIRLRYGWGAVSGLPDCMALGLHHEGSLTQSGATAFDENRYSPVRLAYTESWVDWHLTRMESGETIELRAQHDRPFEVPAEIKV